MNPLEYLIAPQKRIYWLFLLSSIVIALVFLWLYPKEKKLNFSKKLWLHPSAVLDYGYFIFMVFFKVLVIIPLIFGAKEVAIFVQKFLLDYFGFMTTNTFSYYQIMFFFTVSLFIVSDFTRYWLHRFLHTVPFLWRFHQVHHSAKVLTPMTFYRVHPVESVLFGLRYSLSIGIVSGVFLYFFGAKLNMLDVFGVNIFAFIFTLMGANLRHSHIPISFGWLERIFISPKQHQIHHSVKHLNTNFGGFLSLWDGLFGSLTLSKKVNKRLKFGLKTAQMSQFKSFFNLLLTPLRKQ